MQVAYVVCFPCWWNSPCSLFCTCCFSEAAPSRWEVKYVHEKVWIWIFSGGGTHTVFIRTYNSGKKFSYTLKILFPRIKYLRVCVSVGLAASEMHKQNRKYFLLVIIRLDERTKIFGSFTHNLWMCCRDVILLKLHAAMWGHDDSAWTWTAVEGFRLIFSTVQ